MPWCAHAHAQSAFMWLLQLDMIIMNNYVNVNIIVQIKTFMVLYEYLEDVFTGLMHGL